MPAQSLNSIKERLPLLTLVLLLITASRILHIGLADRPFHTDEVWSVWQLIGPHIDYTRDTNWPPLYYILLDGWRRLVGLNPIVLRMLSVLSYMLGLTASYRALRRLQSHAAGLLGMLAYSAVGIGLFVTTEIRGYALVYSLLPVVLWLTLRYFARPRLGRAVPLALCMAAMFYTAYGSFGAFLLLGVFSMIAYRQHIWRWWLPGILAALLAVPGILSIMSLAVGRVSATQGIKLPPLLPAVLDLYQQNAGYTFATWAVLFVIATVLILTRLSLPKLSGRVWGLLAWALSPVLLYALNRYLGLFAPLYSWFTPLGMALWVALGLSLLPRIGQAAAGLALVGVLATPVPFNIYRALAQPLPTSLEWLSKNARWGDVIVIDPHWTDRLCNCIDPEAWDYLIRVYFPQGLRIVDKPSPEYRRIWYLKWVSFEDSALEQSIRKDRVEGVFVGPPEALFRLYELPPDRDGMLFENGLRFHGAEVVDETEASGSSGALGLLTRRSGDPVHVRLWWSVAKPLTADYSIALHVYDQGTLTMQSDGAPQPIDGPKETSQWQPGRYYIEDRLMTVPRGLATGAYPIYLTVYQWWDSKRIAAPGVNADTLLPILTLHVRAF